MLKILFLILFLIGTFTLLKTIFKLKPTSNRKQNRKLHDLPYSKPGGSIGVEGGNTNNIYELDDAMLDRYPSCQGLFEKRAIQFGKHAGKHFFASTNRSEYNFVKPFRENEISESEKTTQAYQFKFEGPAYEDIIGGSFKL